jgi:hypothetical protein
MPATVTQVAEGIKTRLATISGLRAYSYQTEQINTPPFAYPELTQVEYHRAFGGGDVVMTFIIHVVVGRYTDRTAFALLDDFLSYSGAKSIRACLEADKTLGGVCQTLVVPSGADISSLGEAGAEFLEIQISLTVHA